MQITKDINIDTKDLAENSNITIQYTGKLCDSNKVFICYGTTPNTFEYNVQELINNNISIHLEDAGYFYFYFIDENNNIDNNNSKDYQLYIKRSSLIFSDNCSMKELPYKYFDQHHIDNSKTTYKTFFTPYTLKNTSKPQEIIIPKPFDSNSPTAETKNVYGLTLEPAHPIKEFKVSSHLIPTDEFALIVQPNKKSFFSKFRKFGIALKKFNFYIKKAINLKD